MSNCRGWAGNQKCVSFHSIVHNMVFLLSFSHHFKTQNQNCVSVIDLHLGLSLQNEHNTQKQNWCFHSRCFKFFVGSITSHWYTRSCKVLFFSSPASWTSLRPVAWLVHPLEDRPILHLARHCLCDCMRTPIPERTDKLTSQKIARHKVWILDVRESSD